MAKLTIDALATCLTIKELKLALSNIPSGLRFAYDATIQRILDQGPSRSRRAFELMKWVLHAKRPLKSAEIEHAVSIEHESEDIDRDDIVPATTLASLCAGLVVIDEYGDFRFIHQTVSEYLTKHHSEKFHDADGFLAESCLVYLGYKEFAQGPCEDICALQARRLQYPAYSYCARYWHQHLTGRDTLCEGLKKAALKIFESEPHWRSAFQDLKAPRDSLSSISENDTILHLGAYLDAHLLFGDLMRLGHTCLNRQGSYGESPLMLAAWHGGLKFASNLLEAGAEPEIRGEFGHNALHLAVWAGRQDLTDLLIVNPRVNINSPIATTQARNGGQTALILAAHIGYTKIVDRLLEAGAEVNTLDNQGISALQWAVSGNHLQVVDLLIAAPEIDINNRDRCSEDEVGGKSALMLAAREGNVEIVTSLVSAGADLTISDHKGRAALHMAVETGNVVVVEFLVRSLISGRADLNQVDNTGNTALHYAASMGRAAVVEILVKSLISIRADLTIFNDTGNTALHIAVEKGHVAVVEILVSNGMDVDLQQAKLATKDDVGDFSAVMIASVKGHVDTLEILLQRSRNIDLCDSKKRTALLLAIAYKQVEAAKLLLSQKTINIELVDDSGGTPLIAAATYGISSIIPDLVARGAQLNRRTDLACAPIMQAVARGHTETAKTLLSIPGIDVNTIPPWTGRTPLHYAVSWGNAELVELLISHGADLHVRDNVNGFRPIEYALYFNDQRILDLLRASDAQNGIPSG
jgi:ankyrin repeat protein